MKKILPLAAIGAALYLAYKYLGNKPTTAPYVGPTPPKMLQAPKPTAEAKMYPQRPSLSDGPASSYNSMSGTTYVY